MLKKIALGVGVLLLLGVGALLVFASGQPDQMTVERSCVIKSTPEQVFAVIGDLHRNTEWSPWEKLDPNIKRTFSGSASGKGAVYGWNGNADVGEGSIEVVEFSPPTKMVMTLHFIRPMEGTDTVTYLLEPQGDSTKITWTMQGPMNYVGKVMQLVMNCQGMCEQQFDQGLSSLKTICEKPV